MSRAVMGAVLAIGACAFLFAAAPSATAAGEPAGPIVRVHGGKSASPALELALDEVALLWSGGPRRAATPPALIEGASVLRVGRDAAAVGLSGVTSAADLLARARALRDANPDWEARLVLYTPGVKRTARTRRLLTEEIAVVGADGAVTREHASDPLATLDLAESIARRPGVARAEPLAAPPDYLAQKLARKLAKLARQDQPHEAQAFFALKRVPPGAKAIPVERYFQAREQMKQMPLHSTATGLLHPSAAALGMSFDTAAAFLGSWSQLGPGNIGGRTRALVIHPTTPATMYAAGVAGGVWKTTNGGASWTPLTDTLLPNLAVASMEMDPTNPNVIYAGTGEFEGSGEPNGVVRGAGIFKTIDGGSTWSRLASTANRDFYFVNSVKVLPNGTTVLAGTLTGLWRSLDGGGTWTRTLDTSDVNGCFDIALASSYALVSCGTFAQGTVYRSIDSGASFTAVLGDPVLIGATGTADTSMGFTALAIARANESVAYALASSIADGDYQYGLDAVYRSDDGGQTWTATVTNTNATLLNTLLLSNPIGANLTQCGFTGTNQIYSQGDYDNVIAVDPADPTGNRVWAGGIDLFRSDDGGQNWRLASFWWRGASPGSFAHADQHAIVFHPGYDGTGNTTMFVGSDGGVFRTPNARTATTTDVCGTTDSQVSWTALNNNYGVTQFYFGLPFPGANGGTTYFGGTQDNGTILGSDSAGINGWAQIQGGDGGWVAVDPTTPFTLDVAGTLYAETTNLSLRKSIDGGNTFSPDMTSGITEPGSDFLFIAPFTMSPNDPRLLWIGGRQMWRTTDAATSWSAASASFGCGAVSAIAVAPGNDDLVLAGTAHGCLFKTTAARSATGATTWTGVTPSGSAGYLSWIAFDPSDTAHDTIYVIFTNFTVPHVWKTTDGGTTWTNIDGSGPTGLPDVPTHTITVDPSNPSVLYVGTDLGVFSSTDGGANWAVENTGFANVITEALTLGQIGGHNTLFAFTHGRGAWRVALVPPPPDLAVTPAPSVTPANVMQGSTVIVDNTVRNIGGLPAGAPFSVAFALVPVTPAGTDIPLSVTRLVSTLLAPGQTSRANTSVVIPATTPAGAYKIRVAADPLGAVTDGNPANNNALTGVITVALPDLTVPSVTFTPGATGPGLNVSVTHTLRNIATSAINASVSGIYLATNASFNTVIGPAIARVSAPTVRAGTTSAAITKSVQLPAGTAPGRYVVLVRANDDGALLEIGTANNVGASAGTLLVGPDLLVTAATTVPGASPGMNASVHYTLKNQGGQAAGPFTTGFTLVAISPAGPDIPLGPTSDAVALAAGASLPVVGAVTIPSSTTPGQYRIRVSADSASAVAEADETNNALLTGVLTVARADLTVSSVTFTPLAVAPGMNVSITHTVRNLALAPGSAGPTVSSLGFAPPGGTITQLGLASIPALAAGSTATVTRSVPIPATTPIGIYLVSAAADAFNAVVESSELNNVTTASAPLIVGPDLVVTAATTGTSFAPGTNASVTYTIKNQGGSPTGSTFAVGFALVPVNGAGVPAGPDIPVGPSRTGVPALAVGATTTLTSSVLIPGSLLSGVPAGTYRVRVIADADNVVLEADETNNTRLTGTLSVVRPDLTVSSVTFTPAAISANIAAAGTNVSVTHVLQNLAPVLGGAPASVSRLYLSRDRSVGGQVLDFGAVPAGAIVAGGMATVPKVVTIPANTSAGVYFFVVQANAGGAFLEANAGNNVGATGPFIIGADLTVTAAGTTTAPALPGSNVSVNATIKNQGGDPAVASMVAYTLVPTSAAPGDADIPLGASRAVPALAAGAMTTLASTITLPAGLTAGQYRVRVIADATDVVPEADETNNALLTNVFSVVRPDLTVTSVTFTPQAIAPGMNVSITHTVKNLAVAPGGAPPSTSRLGLAPPGGSAVELGRVNVPAIAAGSTATVTKSVTVPALTAPGRYAINATADALDAIVEAGELNNDATAAARLIVGPDLLVSAASTVTGASPGTNVSVRYTLKNQGGQAAGPFTTGFALAPTSDLSGASDIPLGPPPAAVTLAAGASMPLSALLTIPSGTGPGPYRIRVTADSANVVVEADETNNSLLTGVLNVVLPDLVISALSLPAKVITGRTLSIANTVKNNGAAPATASAFHVGFYISPDPTIDRAVDTLVGARAVASLGPLATSTVPVSVTVPATVGSFFIGAAADYLDEVAETNEGNNVFTPGAPLDILPEMVRTTTASVTASLGGSSCPAAAMVTYSGTGPFLIPASSQTSANPTHFTATTSFTDTPTGRVVSVTASGTVDATSHVSGTATVAITQAGLTVASGSVTFSGSTTSATATSEFNAGFTGTLAITGGGSCATTGSIGSP